MEKQVLSINQMQHLKELGVDTSKASMHWQFLPTADAIINETDELEEKPCLFVSQPNMKHEYPAFTLQDMLDIMPEIIDAHIFTIEKEYGLWSCMYLESYTRSIIRIKTNKELINAAYEMLCWCAENGYLNKK